MSQAERDKALERVRREAWQNAVRIRVDLLPAGWEGTGEDVRLLVMRMPVNGLKMPPPHHPNAWGAAIMWCVKHDLLEKTGRDGQMRTPSSHARSTEILRRTRTRLNAGSTVGLRGRQDDAGQPDGGRSFA